MRVSRLSAICFSSCSISDNANGGGEMDYATFAQMAAERTHRVVRALLEGVSA